MFFKILAAIFFSLPLFALTQIDRANIEKVICDYTESWNLKEGRGFGKDFTEDADFVNIFGTKFSGKTEIESRHVKILQTIFKGSNLQTTKTELREVNSDLVIANVWWRLKTADSEYRDGVFTQVFLRSNGTWKITASQNTMMPKG